MTATRVLETLLTGGTFFEGPRWHDGSWWVSDFYRHHVLRISPTGAAGIVVEVPGQPSGLGFLPDGSLVISSMLDRRVLRYADGKLTVLADVAHLCGGHLNDLVTDARGHSFVGDFGYDLGDPASERTTSLKRVDPDGSVHLAAEGLAFPNGMVITQDGRTLIVGESKANRYTAFDLADDGTLTGRRTWAAVGPDDHPEQPRLVLDGCAIDAEDHLWVADIGGRRFARVEPGGRVVEEIAAPEGLNAIACALGGQDRRTLLLCCSPGFGPDTEPGAATLLTTQVDVPGTGRP